MCRKVVFVARPEDIHVDVILDECVRRGADAFRFDVTSLLGGKLNVNLNLSTQCASWTLSAGVRTASPTDDMAIFCRNWDFGELPSTEDLEGSVAVAESQSFLNAWAAMVPMSQWVDHPTVQAQWDNKLSQTALAQSIGLRVPKTIATNQPKAVQEFARDCKAVIKQLSNIAFNGIDNNDEFIFTTPLDPHHLDNGREIATCPILVQERIEKVADLRVTVVGNEVFPALIRTSTGTAPADSVDFRIRHEESIQPTTIPDQIVEAIHKMMRHMGLRFAAFDFGVSKEGEYFFFEANVSGNWLWIENATELPISSAVADLLLNLE